MFPDGATATQCIFGNVWKRLQIQPDDNITVYKSVDGGKTWPEIKTLITNTDITFLNTIGFDIAYDTSTDTPLIRWRIRNNLSYQLCVNNSNIFLDRWDGATWSRVWTK